VGVGREAGAASKLLLSSGADGDGILHGTQAAGIQRSHVEDIDVFHLTENLETLDTGGLLEVGGNGSRLSTGAEKVVLGLDLYKIAMSCQPQFNCPLVVWCPAVCRRSRCPNCIISILPWL
jgi:hypothetical protein